MLGNETLLVERSAIVIIARRASVAFIQVPFNSIVQG